jgi:hypothetical protein
MKRLTKEEVSMLEFLPRRIIKSPIIREISMLEIGEALFIEKNEWTIKTPPSTYMGSYFRQKRSEKVFSVRKTDDNGFYVLRLN